MTFLFLVPKNINFLRKRKYHYTVDNLFDRFGFDKTLKSVVHSKLEKQLKPIQEVSRTEILPLTKTVVLQI